MKYNFIVCRRGPMECSGQMFDREWMVQFLLEFDDTVKYRAYQV